MPPTRLPKKLEAVTLPVTPNDTRVPRLVTYGWDAVLNVPVTLVATTLEIDICVERPITKGVAEFVIVADVDVGDPTPINNPF